ncbi:MAG: hypothetical protein U0441_31660 [Polyangiaceae bacterium]
MRRTTMFGALAMMAATSAILVAPGCNATMEGAAKTYVSAMCARMFKCTPVLVLAFEDQVTCETFYSPEMEWMFALPDVDFGADQVQRCADDMREASCDKYYSYSMANPDCPMVGTRAEKDACAAYVQCASGYCSVAGGAECGVCAPTAALGADCTAASPVCESGSYCGEDGKCAAIPVIKEGDACASGWCGNSLRCVDGKCAAPIPEGGACTSEMDCDRANGYACANATKKCTRLKVAAVGEACGDSLTMCSIDGNCDGQKCVARPQLGEACFGNNMHCAVNLMCVDGKCAEQTYPTCD